MSIGFRGVQRANGGKRAGRHTAELNSSGRVEDGIFGQSVVQFVALELDLGCGFPLLAARDSAHLDPFADLSHLKTGLTDGGGTPQQCAVANVEA